jgi:amino acid transporter
VRDPQRTIPIALILSVALSTIIYVLLQVAFLGSVPVADIAHGWSGIGKLFALPFHDIAMALGVGWLAFLVVCDAIISPSGCGNIYMNATPRVVYGWARSGTFFKVFTRVDDASGIPRPALWLTFALAIFWMLPFPSWSAMISVVSAALVLSYAVAPITTASLRRTAPQLHRPFRVRGFAVIGPLSFVIAALIVYWSGWKTVSWLLGVQIVLYVVYVPWRGWRGTDRGELARDVRASLWLVGFYWLMIALSWLGTFGGKGIIASPWDSVLVAAVALAVYAWGARSGLPFSLPASSADDED